MNNTYHMLRMVAVKTIALVKNGMVLDPLSVGAAVISQDKKTEQNVG